MRTLTRRGGIPVLLGVACTARARSAVHRVPYKYFLPFLATPQGTRMCLRGRTRLLRRGCAILCALAWSLAHGCAVLVCALAKALAGKIALKSCLKRRRQSSENHLANLRRGK